MKSSRIFFLLIVLVFSVSAAQAQKEISGQVADGMGPQPGFPPLGTDVGFPPVGSSNRPNINVGNAYTDSCPFIPQVSDVDRALLTDARSQIQALTARPECQVAVQSNFTALDQALDNFRNYAGFSNALGTSSNPAPGNCYTYERVIDLQYNQFVRYYPAATSTFRSCVNMANREEALTCALEQASSQKRQFEQNCAQINASQSRSVALDQMTGAYSDAVTTLQRLIQNPNCGDTSSRKNLLNLGLSMAGRAASFIPVGGAGVLLGGLTELAQAAISAIVGSRINDADPVVQAQRTDNFRQLACLYTKLDERHRNCDRLAARQNLDASASSFERARQICMQEQPSPEVERLVSSLDPVIARIGRSPATEGAEAPAAMSDNDFQAEAANLVVAMVRTKFPGTNESMLDVGLQSIEGLVSRHNDIINNPEAANEVLRSRNPGQEPLSVERTQLVNESRQAADKLNQVKEVLLRINALKDSDTPENYGSLRTALASFQGGSFRNEFSRILQESKMSSGAFSEQIGAYNSAVSARSGAESVMRNQASWNRTANSDDQAAMDLRNRYVQYQPQMRRYTNYFLDIATRDLASYKSAPSMDQETKQRIWDTHLYPAIIACNNLRSAMVEMPSRRGTFDASAQHRFCGNLNCTGGVPTFTDFLAQKGSSFNPRACDSGDCTTEYSRYVCTIDENREPAVNNFRNSFFQSGQICGRSIAGMVE